MLVGFRVCINLLQDAKSQYGLQFSELDDFHRDRIFERMTMFTKLRALNLNARAADRIHFLVAEELGCWLRSPCRPEAQLQKKRLCVPVCGRRIKGQRGQCSRAGAQVGQIYARWPPLRSRAFSPKPHTNAGKSGHLAGAFGNLSTAPAKPEPRPPHGGQKPSIWTRPRSSSC